MSDGNPIVFGEDGELFYEGRRIHVRRSRFGNRYILNVDGKRIRVNEDRFTLLYAYFSAVFMQVTSENPYWRK